MENETQIPYLTEFAFCGTIEGYTGMLRYLSEQAEPEKWTFDGGEEYGILKKYINGTFRRCYSQEKLIYSPNNEFCCFNTGLLTPNCNDIIAIFEKNDREEAQPWVLKGFFDESERFFMNKFSIIPSLATYTDKFEKYYFNPNLKIVISSDHILDDNWERIKSVITLDKMVVKSLLVGLVEETKKKIARNMRLVVPQFYKDEIMYLMPIVIPISDDSSVTMALAVELTETNQYRANTIFTKEMAYEKARLLMKPESNWLI